MYISIGKKHNKNVIIGLSLGEDYKKVREETETLINKYKISEYRIINIKSNNWILDTANWLMSFGITKREAANILKKLIRGGV